MADLWEALVFGQYALTALLAGFNALYFARRPETQGHRRLGAVVLAVVNGGILTQSVFFGLVLFPRMAGAAGWAWIAVGGLGLLGTALVTALILRQVLGAGG